MEPPTNMDKYRKQLLVINGHRERITLAVTKLHSHHIFLGFD
jgi:hypothetical protein